MNIITIEIDDPILALIKSNANLAIENNDGLYTIMEMDFDGIAILENIGSEIRIETQRGSKRFEARLRKCLKPITRR